MQPLPGTQKMMFHVEHTPIQILSSLFGCAFEQTKAVRVDQLQRQGVGQLRCSANRLAINSNLVISLFAPRDTHGCMQTTVQFDFGKHRTCLMLVLNNGMQTCAAKGAG